MSDVVIGVIVRPLTMIVLLLAAWGISRLLWRVIPAGRIKDALYKKRPLIPGADNEAR